MHDYCVLNWLCCFRNDLVQLSGQGFVRIRAVRHGCFGLETKVVIRIYGITQSKQCLMSSLSLPFCDICFENSFLPKTTLLTYLNVAITYSIAFLTEHTHLRTSFLTQDDNAQARFDSYVRTI